MQPHTQATPDRGGGDARLSADSSDSESSSGSEASGSDAELAAGAARTSDQSANTDRRKSGKQRVKSQDGRANKMVARHYSKIVERLTRISLTLEDPSSVAPMRKKATRTTKKLAKHMLKYEKELAKLDKLIESRSASHLVYGTLPLGLLKYEARGCIDSNFVVSWLVGGCISGARVGLISPALKIFILGSKCQAFLLPAPIARRPSFPARLAAAAGGWPVADLVSLANLRVFLCAAPSTTTWTPTTGPRPACWTSTSGRPTSYAAS
eukprot:GHVT01020389.1.p1 GENE.GHVT01020389.1~~GHVT01020389.1.p1  ORF type:complete len:267 (+),score=45.67 GHVT01020389.1:356-1156(+)